MSVAPTLLSRERGDGVTRRENRFVPARISAIDWGRWRRSVLRKLRISFFTLVVFAALC